MPEASSSSWRRCASAASKSHESSISAFNCRPDSQLGFISSFEKVALLQGIGLQIKEQVWTDPAKAHKFVLPPAHHAMFAPFSPARERIVHEHRRCRQLFSSRDRAREITPLQSIRRRDVRQPAQRREKVCQADWRVQSGRPNCLPDAVKEFG